MFLFFSPDAGIKPHFKTSLQLYDIIKKKFTNNKIYLTNCDANYSWCTVYDAAQINNNFLLVISIFFWNSIPGFF